jgi:hypothetical protein
MPDLESLPLENGKISSQVRWYEFLVNLWANIDLVGHLLKPNIDLNVGNISIDF